MSLVILTTKTATDIELYKPSIFMGTRSKLGYKLQKLICKNTYPRSPLSSKIL